MCGISTCFGYQRWRVGTQLDGMISAGKPELYRSECVGVCAVSAYYYVFLTSTPVARSSQFYFRSFFRIPQSCLNVAHRQGECTRF